MQIVFSGESPETGSNMKPVCPLLTVDTVIFTDGGIALVRRGHEPFKGRWALPGGFVEVGETVENAAVREALEETGLEVELVALLGVFSDPGRDPRGHTVSVVFIGRAAGGTLQGGSDAAEARVFDASELPELAFDHSSIISQAVEASLELGLLRR